MDLIDWPVYEARLSRYRDGRYMYVGYRIWRENGLIRMEQDGARMLFQDIQEAFKWLEKNYKD